MKKAKKVDKHAELMEEFFSLRRYVSEMAEFIERKLAEVREDLIAELRKTREASQAAQSLLLSYEGEREDARHARDAERLRFENLIKAVGEALIGPSEKKPVFNSDNFEAARDSAALAVLAKAKIVRERVKNGQTS